MNTEKIPVRKVFPDGHSEETYSRCICEFPLTVSVNGSVVLKLVCTGENIEELVTGRLFTDGIIRNAADITSFSFSDNGHIAEITADTDICPGAAAVCDTINAPATQKKLLPIEKTVPDTETVFGMIRLFSDDSGLHRKTGAAHRCIIRCENEDGSAIHAVFEDISRHNAVDKAVGFAVRSQFDMKRCILFTSGRVPVDMAKKVIAAGIPVLISKSVPSEDAVRLSMEYGLTLICRAWSDSCEIYTEYVPSP